MNYEGKLSAPEPPRKKKHKKVTCWGEKIKAEHAPHERILYIFTHFISTEQQSDIETPVLVLNQGKSILCEINLMKYWLTKQLGKKIGFLKQ